MIELDAIIASTSNACSPGAWAAGEWFRCAFSPLVNSLGEPLVGLLTGGTVVFSMYLAGQGLAAPAVVTILLGAALVPLLPGGMVGVAFSIAFVGLVAGLVSVARKYVLDNATI